MFGRAFHRSGVCHVQTGADMLAGKVRNAVGSGPLVEVERPHGRPCLGKGAAQSAADPAPGTQHHRTVRFGQARHPQDLAAIARTASAIEAGPGTTASSSDSAAGMGTSGTA